MMAEFSEVMDNMARMCKMYWPDGDDECSKDCPLYSLWCLNMELDCPQVDRRQLEMKEVETVVMQWAAENPEPVYPMWEEWLITQGVIKENPNGGVGYPMPKLFERIPADIAKKLGIEPKEG